MPFRKSVLDKRQLMIAASFSATVVAAMSQPAFAQTQSCSGQADVWFANDESDSVVDEEGIYALDFLYQLTDQFTFSAADGTQAAIFGWSDAQGAFDYILPATATFGDTGDTGLLDPNGDGLADDTSIVIDGDLFGIRELYQERNYAGGTWLGRATKDLAERIGDNTDSNSDGVTDNGRRSGASQIAVLLTDANQDQLGSIGEGAAAGNRGGADWEAAIADLVALNGGTELVLVLIDQAADVYTGSVYTEVKDFIDGLVANYGVKLVIGDSFEAMADPAQGHITSLSSTICDLTDLVARLDAPGSFTNNDPFTVTFTFSEDVTGFDANDIALANATLSEFTAVSGAEYTATVTPDGTQTDISIDIAAAAAQSSNGRQNVQKQALVTFDTDGDGVGDSEEGTVADDDGDGIPNFQDLDSDNDNIPDVVENNPANTEDTDTDGDGTPDYLDIDSDNDGIPDSVEAYETVPPFSGADTDGDGIDDAIDADNGGPTADANNNGISDVYEPLDTDGDGIPDYRDLDSDNDSLSDISESGGEDSDGNAQVDDLADQGTTDNPTDSDSDGLPDYRDLQSDNYANDGAGDYDIDNGNLGDGQANSDGTVTDTTDADQDGLVNVVDSDPGSFGEESVPASGNTGGSSSAGGSSSGGGGSGAFGALGLFALMLTLFTRRFGKSRVVKRA